MAGNYPQDARLRPWWRRVGITLLNWPVPGTGVLRVGRPVLALAFLAVAISPMLLVQFLPGRGQEALAGIAIMALAALTLATVIGAMALSWRQSRRQPDDLPWFSRAPSIIAFMCVGIGMTLLLPDIQASFKGFYAPSESMVPTLRVGDRFWTDMRQPIILRRGDLIVYRSRSAVFSSRIVAIGGDRIEVVGGVPSVNGVRAVIQPDGAETVTFPDVPLQARRFVEISAGRSHGIVDIGNTPQHNFAEARVPPGMVFVMGDNRDNAEDSRFASEVGGVGFVRVDDVIGRPIFRFYTRAGSPLGSLGDK